MVSVGLRGWEEEQEDGLQGDVGVEDDEYRVFKGCCVEDGSGCMDLPMLLFWISW